MEPLKPGDYITIMLLPNLLIRGEIKFVDEPFGGMIIEQDNGIVHHVRTWITAQPTDPNEVAKEQGPELEIVQ